ncbi:tellurium resistance protein [Streptomyces sp. NPDC005955]|uniref:tellurium resistance protein n=1 Tax=Streptomyces sp. NPDC005955 TaxID=3364738 RepID=UPI00368DB350
MHTSEHRPGDDRRRQVIDLRGPTAPTAPTAPAPAPSRQEERPRPPTRLRAPEPGAREPGAPEPLVLSAARPQTRIGGRGVLQANLNWRPGVDADLDLGCLVACREGDGTAVQALGDAYGSLTAWPYVSLDQDDRTGASSDGETLRVSLDHAHLFERLLLYVYVYEGAVDFRSLGAAVTVSAPGQQDVRIDLDDSPTGATACAIALVRPAVDGLSLRREVRWFRPAPELWIHQQIDAAYGFGFEWVYATKGER